MSQAKRSKISAALSNQESAVPLRQSNFNPGSSNTTSKITAMSASDSQIGQLNNAEKGTTIKREKILESVVGGGRSSSTKPPPGKKEMTKRNGNSKETENCTAKSQGKLSAMLRNDSFANSKYPEVLILISQFCQEFGLSKTLNALVNEENVEVESSLVCNMKNHLLEGEWKTALSYLNQMLANGVLDQEVFIEVKIVIYTQIFMELVHAQQYIEASLYLKTLVKIANEKLKPEIMKLSVLLFCPKEKFAESTEWDTSVAKSRAKLVCEIQKVLGPEIMLPPGRLLEIIKHSLTFQSEKCKYHSGYPHESLDSISILDNHECSMHTLPSICSQTIEASYNEIWECKFSPDAKYLAIGGKGGFLAVYTVCDRTHQVLLFRTYKNVRFAVQNIVWSPNSKYFIVSEIDEKNDKHQAHIYLLSKDESEENLIELNAFEHVSLHICEWFEDSKKIIAGSNSGSIRVFNLLGNVLYTWNHKRVKSLHRLKDDKFLMINAIHKVYVFEYEDKSHLEILSLENPVMSSAVDSQARYLLIMIQNEGLRMYNIETNTGVLLINFRPQIPMVHVNHATFGGFDDKMIAIGDERTKKILIWHRNYRDPVASISGDTSNVSTNAVHWNPHQFGMLASVNDSGHLKIWLSDKCYAATKETALSSPSPNKAEIA